VEHCPEMASDLREAHLQEGGMIHPALASFHPTVRAWFASTLGEPSAPQMEGWPHIRGGRHTLIAAPTGSGKTLAAFLSAIDSLLTAPALPDETRVLYVSPLKALASDIQKNLEKPLAEMRALDSSLPEIRAVVRTGDTAQKVRAQMLKKPPHIVVTTPESLYILLTSEGGRRILSTVETVIVDEIHALARDKRGAHLALSLERLEALCHASTGRIVQRIGLSATQKPLSEVGRFLVGVDRECALVDTGHLRRLDLAVEVPSSPLSAVCCHEVWEEIYERIAELVRQHRTTIAFVNTRRMAERIAARLGALLEEGTVACHHGSLSADKRHAAEQRLKSGSLRVLVATASLELGIDIGDVDLALQIGASRSIATLLQRVGRAGHGKDRIPKGRIFPLTTDELVESVALLRSIDAGVLDRTPMPSGPLDILAQQIVASTVPESWPEDLLFQTLTRAYPYRELERDAFDQTVGLHTEGRWSLLHRDGVGKTIRATKRARLTAITSGGAIADTADYQVLLEPEGTFIGTLNEDFAIESMAGDVFQLGTASWRILSVRSGTVRVADAQGAPPTIPFWLGEAPSRTRELSQAICEVRELVAEGEKSAESAAIVGLPPAAHEQLVEHVRSGIQALGALPTQECIVLERFFDETGGMQLVMHAPFGGRINRALGLALRKRFCRGFGFELQAAANEEAIVLSLGPQHSFPLEEVFDYLHPNTARDLLIQAVLTAPMFKTRFRWNVSRALLVERMRGGKKTPAPLLRMRSDDLLAAAFPDVVACGENLPPGDIPVPMEHPLVRQTVEDCLHEAMDVDGFLEVLQGLRSGAIRRVAVDTTEPSSFACGILSAQPYTFLDDAPLEERRTQAVLARRTLDVKTADELGALDPEAILRVKQEAWPSPSNVEEVHEALLWMGYLTVHEAEVWGEWLSELKGAGRVVREDGRWFAVEASRDPKDLLRGRLEALGPIFADDPELGPLLSHLHELEREGVVLRGRFDGRPGYCNRRLLARIHRYTLDRLRKEIEPVSAADFLRFLGAWQYASEEYRVDGPRGVFEVVRKLAGLEAPAAAWEASILPTRVRDYRREWLDSLTLSGEVAWARLWGSGATSPRSTPICLLPRESLDDWLTLASPPDTNDLSSNARAIHSLLKQRGAMFQLEILRGSRLLEAQLESGLAELVARAFVTCDSYEGLRALLAPAHQRRRRAHAAGRWSLLRNYESVADPQVEVIGERLSPSTAAKRSADPDGVEQVARQLLLRTGVVFRRTLLREKQPFTWRELLMVLRTLEARGEIRGGRFVSGFEGEQYALPEAVSLLRQVRRREPGAALHVAAADPLNLRGILTPDERVSPLSRRRVQVA
jgi:ATP-dependent helicase Lhr and Lhr-like helicase